MIGEIAVRKNIPRSILEQILLEMKRHGIVHSRRGKFGGYACSWPDKITYGQVLRIIDGPIAPLPCLSRIAYRAAPTARARREIRRVLPGRASRHERSSTARPSPIPWIELLADDPGGGAHEMAHL